MNIKILDSWLREYLKTDAKPNQLAKAMSLTSVSIERIEEHGRDKLYDIEVTTNRPDLMSVVGLAREAAAVLPHFGHSASFIRPKRIKPKEATTESINVKNDPTLVNRVMAVVMEVEVEESPKDIQERLETSEIRSLNNVIDVTNYVMRTVGHPTHVFDFDRLNTKNLTIRPSKKGETVQTLDKKTHTLTGGDIVAVDDNGRIIDLLGVMGLENSVVTKETKRILFFIDNNDPIRMRKTSMGLAIRSDAAQMNEKDIDPELAEEAMYVGIELFTKIAKGKLLSEITDIYPNKPKQKTITVSLDKIESLAGVPIGKTKTVSILKDLGFGVEEKNAVFHVTPPSFRQKEIEIEEDVIEEITRVYGYHNLPSILPNTPAQERTITDEFYWENRIKDAMKYWGFTEVYTYSMVSDTQFEGPLEDAVTIRNPLDVDHVHMRKTIVPSLLEVVNENKTYQELNIFEIANIYQPNGNKLPLEKRMFAGVIKQEHASFFEVKGLIEQLSNDMGIKTLRFKPISTGGLGADILIGKTRLGDIEILDEHLINFELDFEELVKHATLNKTYTPISKYPPILEDMAFRIDKDILTGDIIETIKKVSTLIKDVSLLDRYEDTRTFHIVYQDRSKNMSNEDVSTIREAIVKLLKKTYNAELK